VFSEWLWEVFGAFAIYHAWSIWVKNATGTMDHVLDYQVIELRFCVRIRELCREKRIDVLWSLELGVMVEEDDEMHVWQAPLLELNGKDMSHRYPQSTLFDVIHNSSHLCSEDT
jgi:hypothetical protein